MAAIKITNPKISLALVEELQNEPEYQNQKTFSATRAFLSNLVSQCQDQEYANIPAKKIKEWFETYNVNYRPCLDVLVSHELIEIDKQYIVGQKSRGYRLTDKGVRLMYQGQMEYLKKQFANKALKRKLQKQQSYHRTKNPKYKHKFLEYIHNGLMGYTYDQAALKHIEGSNWGYFTRLKAIMNLTTFAERDFVDLKYNATDTRCWNEFAGMKSELRRHFSLGNLHYRYVIDIRSCHPLFLAHYLVNEAKQVGWQAYHPMIAGDHQLTVAQKQVKENLIQEHERSESSSIPNSTPITLPSTNQPIPNNSTTTSTNNNPNLHYDGGNSDIQAELTRWNTLFSDPATDPKTVLTNELKYTRKQAKAALNHTINGSKQYRRFIKWFKVTFPKLFALWDRTNKAEVGVGISTFYETELMQDMPLYELAESLGLHLTYEFDGCGVMCSDDDTEVLTKIQQLIAHIQARSEKLWGIRPVIVVKTVTGEAVCPPRMPL